MIITTPALVITRDRLSMTSRCVEELLAGGCRPVHIVDHGSTYPPMLDWLNWLDTRRALPVYRRGNQLPRSLWDWPGLAELVGDVRYVVTDPDVIPDDTDWLSVLYAALDTHPWAVKAGLALHTDDLPAHYQHAGTVRAWEAQHWANPDPCHPWLFHAAVDTTLALYPPLSLRPGFALGPALRVAATPAGGAWARHLTWYEDSGNPDEETRWYRDHLPGPGISHWADPDRYITPTPERPAT